MTVSTVVVDKISIMGEKGIGLGLSSCKREGVIPGIKSFRPSFYQFYDESCLWSHLHPYDEKNILENKLKVDKKKSSQTQYVVRIILVLIRFNEQSSFCVILSFPQHNFDVSSSLLSYGYMHPISSSPFFTISSLSARTSFSNAFTFRFFFSPIFSLVLTLFLPLPISISFLISLLSFSLLPTLHNIPPPSSSRFPTAHIPGVSQQPNPNIPRGPSASISGGWHGGCNPEQPRTNRSWSILLC